MKTPYVGFSNETLDKQLDAKPGDLIYCDTCKGKHMLEPADDGSTFLLFYKCGEKSYLGAIKGKLIVGSKSDVSGAI